ncbi:MAG: hypothetical protein A2W20_07150 [Candidatus Aminicenantes bacterium RBG_16_66_30]|nr:MAG: hypothetical protein A2W20_07150 [Candidatus Aminicenantes bacterium RBG_16_66_30]
MSKPIPKEGIPRVPPEEKLRELATPYREAVGPAAVRRLEARCDGLGLRFAGDELVILAALDTPAKVQQFLSAELYYNDDHASVDQEETATPPRLVLRTGMAHCFEGAMFAYAVNHLHGHEPRLVMLEASQDADHNLVVCRDPATGLYGATAQSRYPGLVGRPAEYATTRALAETYVPLYYSDRTLDPKDLTLVGFSEPVDLVAKYSAGWIGSDEPLWDIYYTYIDDSVLFRYFFDDPGRPHLYPALRALKENWIRIDAAGEPFVSLGDLPAGAREAWDAFWKAYGPDDGPRPRGRAREIEQAFFRLTGTTPIDLDDNAFDLQFFLAAGYRIDQLIK